MKKTLIVIMLFSLVIAGLSFSPVLAEENAEPREEKPVPTLYTTNDKATSTFERIPSPEYIKYFKMIKKDGDVLYGVRIDKPEAALKASTTQIKKDDPRIKASSTANKLEKIAHPSLVNLYEKIQKIGEALWGIKKGDAKKENNASKPAPAPRVVTAEIASCVSAAIEKKDSALKNRLDISNSDLKEIIDLRTACHKSAISNIEKQQDYIQACNKNFRTSHENILKASKEAQKAAWTTYQTDLKACNANATSTQIMIEDGGSNVMETLAQ